MKIISAKQRTREAMWRLLEDRGVVDPPGAYGHIPRFVGTDQAAARLTELPEWKNSQVIKVNPDRAQLPVRMAALEAGKLLYMAVPRMASIHPFYRLDPSQISIPLEQAALSEFAKQFAPTVAARDIEAVDLVVCGSVAVDRRGARLGKGAGYSDIEVALLQEARVIGERTTFVTTVHDHQVVEAEVPQDVYDFGVDLIVTPTRAISCQEPQRTSGVLWEHIAPEKIDSIPALRDSQNRNQ